MGHTFKKRKVIGRSAVIRVDGAATKVTINGM